VPNRSIIIIIIIIIITTPKEKSGSYTRKTFDRFTAENSCTWNITHNTESIAV
jgi:hypothetical protein